MASNLEEIKELITQLSLNEKTQLAHTLIEILAKEKIEITEDECEKLWIEEAVRRSEEIKKGTASVKSFNLVMKEAYNELK